MSKCEEAAAVQNELSARRKDMENAKSAMESLPYKEGQMEALQKVCLLLLMTFRLQHLYISL
jgi:structural maintenance of chromosome 2